MKNGKYLFYKQSSHQDDFPKKFLQIDLEKWQQNEDWNRSFIDFPLNSTDENIFLDTVFWIFKV